MCEIAGWCALGSAQWVGAIGSVIGGIGASAAAWTSVTIARSIRQAENRRRKAEGTALLRLLTPEITVLPVKLHRFLGEETRYWWGSVARSAIAPVPRLLPTTLDRLAEDPIPHATAAVDRLAVLDDLNYASIANDVATLIASMSGLRDAASLVKIELENEEAGLDVRLEKLVDMIRFYRDLAAQLANEMQPTIGMSKTDYVEGFGR